MNRSFLFTPGNVARRVEKALTLAADVVIVDLEDSVAIAEKAATRKQAAAALERPRRARGYVRVNAPATQFCYGDLAETLHRGVDGVVLPKVESAADLHAIDWLMWNLERERGMPEGSIDLMPQIETAAGLHRIDRVLQAQERRADLLEGIAAAVRDGDPMPDRGTAQAFALAQAIGDHGGRGRGGVGQQACQGLGPLVAGGAERRIGILRPLLGVANHEDGHRWGRLGRCPGDRNRQHQRQGSEKMPDHPEIPFSKRTVTGPGGRAARHWPPAARPPARPRW